VHFHGYKIGKTQDTGCLERGITVFSSIKRTLQS